MYTQSGPPSATYNDITAGPQTEPGTVDVEDVALLPQNDIGKTADPVQIKTISSHGWQHIVNPLNAG